MDPIRVGQAIRLGLEPMRDHVTKIVNAYVKGNAVSQAELPALIADVGALLRDLNKAIPPVAATPAVSARRSVLPDAVICLDCGWRGKLLRGHISSAHGLSARAYRDRWGLKADHPLVAPSYSERRSALAISLGLGRRAANPKRALPDAAKKPSRRGRPRKQV
jgi:predicted transcriptional regulator